MSLKHGLLGFLSYGPKTGYDLSKMFFEPLRPSLSQIYRKLSLMAEEKLVVCERVEKGKLPYRNVFSITDKGMDELKRWLKEPPEFVIPRETLLLKLWFGSRMSRKDMIADIRKYARRVRREVESYKLTAGRTIEIGLQGPVGPIDKLYWTMVVERSIAQYEALLEWCDKAVRLISSFDDTDNTVQKK